LKLGIIYCAKFPNGKKYYGKTKNSLESRIKKHYRDSNDNLLFHKALIKYNDSILWSVIEQTTYENLNEREIYWIEQDKTYLRKNGYNLTKGGDGGDTFSNKKHSEKTKQKMSNSRKLWLESHTHPLSGKKRPEHSEKMKGKNNPMFGQKHSNETRQKISKSKTGIKNPKISLSKTGVKLSEEHKMNISKALKGTRTGKDNPRYGKIPWNKK